LGVAGAIIGTLAMGYFNGRAQQQQYDAAAAQAEANARIAEQNAQKADESARQQQENNKINEENQRRKNLLMLGKQHAQIGASGITATGSALNALQEAQYEVDKESGIMAYDNRQKVQGMLDKSTEQVNYAGMYRGQAEDYRSAGRSAMTNSMLGSVFGLAGSLYTPKSAAVSGGGTASTTAAMGTTYSLARDVNVGFGWGAKKTTPQYFPKP